MLRHLGIHIEPEPSVDVLLCRRHFAQPALVLLHRFCLIGKYNFGVDDDREVHHHQLPQHPREGGVGKVFQANERVQQPADLEVFIEFVLNIDAGHLTSCALVHQRFCRRKERPFVVHQRIEGSFNLQENIVLRQPLDLHARGLQCGLNSGHETVELGNQVLMLSPAALDAFAGRHAEARAAHLLFPLQFRRLVVDAWVPDEVKVKQVLQVVALCVFLQPDVRLFAVHCLQNCIGVLLFPVVACDQIVSSFGNLKSHLQSHRSLRQGADQGLKYQLRPVPLLIARVVRVITAHPVSGDK